eukprot:11094971-Alexandrium_andersonii.AAC.2
MLPRGAGSGARGAGGSRALRSRALLPFAFRALLAQRPARVRRRRVRDCAGVLADRTTFRVPSRARLGHQLSGFAPGAPARFILRADGVASAAEGFSSPSRAAATGALPGRRALPAGAHSRGRRCPAGNALVGPRRTSQAPGLSTLAPLQTRAAQRTCARSAAYVHRRNSTIREDVCGLRGQLAELAKCGQDVARALASGADHRRRRRLPKQRALPTLLSAPGASS